MSHKLTFKNTNQTYASPVVKQDTRSLSDDKIAVVYHGTSEAAAENIKKHGLDKSKRTNGATLELSKKTGLYDKAIEQYCYVSTDPSEAAKYAKCHKKPCIVSMIYPKYLLSTKDSQSGTDKAFKVKKICQKYLLPSKKGKLSEDKINIITKQLKEDGIPLRNSDVFNFIEKNWKDPEISLKNCKTSAVEEVAQPQRRITDRILDMYGPIAPGMIFSVDPDMLESLA